MENDNIHRRITGVVLGAVLGLIYGIVAQFINRVLLPDIPLYQPPFGAYGNALLWMLIGAALGFLAAFPSESIPGAFLGGISGAFALVILTLLTGRTDSDVWDKKILATLFLIIPFVGILTPIAGIHRWAVNRVIQARIDKESFWALIYRPLFLAMIVIAVGTRAALPDFAQTMITRTHNLLQVGLQTERTSDLPAPLQGKLVGRFLERAEAPYQLQWENRNVNRFLIPRPVSDRPWEESAVIVRFTNGWFMVCLFADSGAEPACKGFDQKLPNPSG